MKRASAVMIGVALVFALFSVAGAAGYTFTALDYPGAGHTEAWGINNSGLIVGYYDQNAGQDFEPHGFLLPASSLTPWASMTAARSSGSASISTEPIAVPWRAAPSPSMTVPVSAP